MQQMEPDIKFAQNVIANENYVLHNYPDEKFITNISQLPSSKKNKYTNGLIIPKNVKVAVSRMPRNSEQRSTLCKELRQSEVLTRNGNSVYLTPEPGDYNERVMDALVNGDPYEFRYITGKNRQVEQLFSDAKTKNKDANVYMYIESNISKQEAKRRISMVLERHPDYTGRIVVSFQGGNAYYRDTLDLR